MIDLLDSASPLPTPLPVRPPETVSMRTRDGLRLDADMHRPDGPGSWPVLLMRVPHGRRAALSTHYAHPRWYAAHGFVVVVQDVRGTGTSEGRFRPFESERDDGADAVAWAASLPGSSGAVGMMGCGYAGMAQLLALAAAPPALKAVAPALAGWDVYEDWAYEGGAFRVAAVMRMALRHAAESARRVDDGTAYRALAEAAARLPTDDEIPSRPKILRDYGRYTHYDDWLTTPVPGGYWDGLSPRAALADSPPDVAILQIGGWFDHRLAGTLDAHAAWSPRIPCGLLVGPWGEDGWAGGGAAVDVDRLHAAWFGRVLRALPLPDHRPVQLYDLLARRWSSADPWSAGRPVVLHLGTGGLADRWPGSGRLGNAPDAPGLDVVVHDPWSPVPALGGHGSPADGLADRAALDRRPDVACYTMDAVVHPVTLCGGVALELWVEADAPSFDVSAVLSAVMPDGRSLHLTRGHARVEPGTSTRPLTIPMRATCATLPAGSALRLSLAGACYPACPVNPGTGAEPGETRQVDAQPITMLIHSGRDRPSRVTVTVTDG
ncbi:CocE/NonD family hydrolase [Azospirillum sp. RWY-5-1]|uniref:CocE/NonD family hydrolase n=1 Tax=Azospirillum oleiclasticum TaxID=2735135 RepID=A0ABX2T1N5_9PROT|nr:CocE/NonD family hydrolase [Azospirillum oleiclasticum]NYZ11001.1 CocE/NonD family hydrolase [Azospirillum oleiclasticum]NYZ18163.1 CocE/NonD family hydrolase [Azospirillum oleiclasticum]